jgi:hypothetical protein
MAPDGRWAGRALRGRRAESARGRVRDPRTVRGRDSRDRLAMRLLLRVEIRGGAMGRCGEARVPRSGGRLRGSRTQRQELRAADGDVWDRRIWHASCVRSAWQLSVCMAALRTARQGCWC